MCDHKEGKYSTIRLLEGEEEAQDIKDTITICLKRETVTRQQECGVLASLPAGCYIKELFLERRTMNGMGAGIRSRGRSSRRGSPGTKAPSVSKYMRDIIYM